MSPLAPHDILPLAPYVVIALFAVVAALAEAFIGKEHRSGIAYLSLVGLAVAFAIEIALFKSTSKVVSTAGGMLANDKFAAFFNLLYLAIAAGVILQASAYFEERGFHRGEFYSLVLASVLGLMLLSASADMLMLFVALELASIAVYVLAGYERHRLASAEGAMKYFLMGAFSSAVLLFGMAMLYGVAGDTSFAAVNQHLALLQPNAFVIGGVLLVLVGFAFKVSAVPFHAWTPDAYQGAPTPATAYMAAVVKAGAFAAMLRFFVVVAKPVFAASPGWGDALWWLAVLTMIFGNLFALTQDNIKRLLAYSSIAHAGYIATGVVAAGVSGVESASVLFYLVAYAVASVGAFAVVVRFGGFGDDNLTVSRWHGLGIKYPVAGAAMVVFLLAFAGFPPTAGFLAKFYVFKAAVESGFVELAIIGVLASLLSVYYYFRVIVYMYMKPQSEGESAQTSSVALSAVIVVAAVVVLLLGVAPDFVLKGAQEAVKQLVAGHWLALK